MKLTEAQVREVKRLTRGIHLTPAFKGLLSGGDVQDISHGEMMILKLADAIIADPAIDNDLD